MISERIKYHSKVLKTRVLPPKQTYYCICGELITERRRHPCSVCGSLNRQTVVDIEDNLGAKDRSG